MNLVMGAMVNTKFLMKQQWNYAIPLNICIYYGFVGTCMLTMDCMFLKFNSLAIPYKGVSKKSTT
jgi:hypothetical protein